MNYLYNGVELPALPEFYGYPYVVIHRDIYINTYYARAYSDPLIRKSDKIFVFTDGEAGQEWCSLNDGKWGEIVIGTVSRLDGPGIEMLWSNHDILNSDGTLYLAASEPVPIVPTPPSAQTAFCIGKAFGRLIRDSISAQST